jgi:hypothetical protein
VKFYFSNHDKLAKANIVQDAEEMAGPEVWARLTETERKARNAEVKKISDGMKTEEEKEKKIFESEFHKI